jgi:branched-chain amino acid transport system ATP-binding protein
VNASVPTLSVSNLSAWYGQAQALFDVSFDAPAGATVAIIGRNGAGKTTLLSAIARALPEVAGTIRLGEIDISSARAFQAARAGLSLVRDGGRVFRSLTVMQNLTIGQNLAARRGRQPMDVGAVIERFPALRSHEDTSAELLSGGQRQSLAIGMALVSAPSFLLLDEPSAGLAPIVVRGLFEVIAGLAAEGIAVVVAEQNRDIIRGMTDHILVLESGVIVASTDNGSPGPHGSEQGSEST